MAHRIRTSDVAYITNVYPLVDARMTRSDCVRWLAAPGWTQVPTSACIGCPFRSDARWRDLRESSRAEWADAVAFDHAIRSGHRRHGQPALRGRAYLRRSLVPLDRVDLHPTPQRGSEGEPGEGFGNDCHGICGT